MRKNSILTQKGDQKMICPICNLDFSRKSELILHAIDNHFQDNKECYMFGETHSYGAFVCWCGWDSFFLDAFKPDPVNYISATLHLERCGGVEKHWIDWRLKNLNEDLPRWLKGNNQNVKFTAEGGIK